VPSHLHWGGRAGKNIKAVASAVASKVDENIYLIVHHLLHHLRGASASNVLHLIATPTCLLLRLCHSRGVAAASPGLAVDIQGNLEARKRQKRPTIEAKET